MNPLPTHVIDIPIPPVTIHAEGEAVVEVGHPSPFSYYCLNIVLNREGQTYTVEFDREGSPVKGFVVGRLIGNEHRFVANTGNEKTLEQLSNGKCEPIGKMGWVGKGDEGKNIFMFGQRASL